MSQVQTIFRQKNAATIIVFPIHKSDGTLITGATALDSEISSWTDGGAPGAFADCTNEATEIATSSGIYYLSLTAAEMNAEKICIQVKTSSTGAVIPIIIIHTELALGTMKIVAATAGQSALTLTGNTSGVGAFITGGASGNALNLIGGGTSGRGLNITTTDGHGIFINGVGASSRAIYAASSANAGIELVAGGNSPALLGTGAGSGAGAKFTGGATGAGMVINSGLGATGNGLEIAASSANGAGVVVTGSASSTAAGGTAVSLIGGASTWNDVGGKGGLAFLATSGGSHATATAWNPAVRFTAGASNSQGHGFELLGSGAGHALNLLGGATGRGAWIRSQGTANAVEVSASGSAGSGFVATGPTAGIRAIGATNGTGFQAEGAGAGGGVYIAAGATNARGVHVQGTGTAAGLFVTSTGTGSGAVFTGQAVAETAGLGDAVRFEANSGVGIDVYSAGGHGAQFLSGAGSDKAGIQINGGGAGTVGSLNIVTRSGTAAPAINIQPGATTTGAGIIVKGGSGATGNALELTAASTNGNPLKLTATGSGVEILGSGNAELAALPGVTPTMLQMLQFMYEYTRNSTLTTLSSDILYKNDSTTSLGTAPISATAVSTTKGRMV